MKFPFRTYSTNLSNSKLIILDALFDCGVSIRGLRENIFPEAFNLPNSHGLDDAQLADTLQQLCEANILSAEIGLQRRLFYRLTPTGGALWEKERLPNWDYYICDRYRPISDEKSFFTILSPTEQIAEEFLIDEFTPGNTITSSRRRKINDYNLVPWRKFSKLHAIVGVIETNELENFYRNLDKSAQKWWRTLNELQAFIQRSR